MNQSTFSDHYCQLTPSKTDLAWLAGIVDGEGCIRMESRGWSCRLQIGNTNKILLDRCVAILDHFGCPGHYQEWQPTGNRKRAAKVSVLGPDVVGVLTALLPYLTGKRREAEAVLELYKLRAKCSRIPTSHEREALEGFRTILKDIKREHHYV